MPDSCLDKGQEGNSVGYRPTTHTATSCSCFHRSQRIKGKFSASMGGGGRIKLELPEISLRSRLTFFFFFKEALGYGGGHSIISTIPRGDTKERLDGK